MAQPITSFIATSSTLYAVIRNSSAQVWNGTAFVTFVNQFLSTYAISLTSVGGDMYSATFPTGCGTGVFSIVIYIQAGGSPATSDAINEVQTYRNDGSSSSGSSGPYLTTLANIKTYLGISGTSYDAKLNMLLPAVSSAVTSYCDRLSFFDATFDERYDGRASGLNSGYLSLRNVPITGITSVTFNPDDPNISDTYTGSQFTYVADQGGVFWSDAATQTRPFDRGFQNIEVIYRAGYTSIPDDLDTATAMVAAAFFQQSDTNPALKSERIGDYAYTNGRVVGNDPWATCFRDAAPLLAKYKRTGAL